MNIDYVNLIYRGLPNKVRALSVENADSGFTIIVNKNITFEMQLDAVKHEMWHIANNDFRKNDVNAIEQNAHAV